MAAAQKSYSDIVRLLLQAGADLNLKNGERMTALTLARAKVENKKRNGRPTPQGEQRNFLNIIKMLEAAERDQ